MDIVVRRLHRQFSDLPKNEKPYQKLQMEHFLAIDDFCFEWLKR
jgi:hypothetical protein